MSEEQEITLEQAMQHIAKQLTSEEMENSTRLYFLDYKQGYDLAVITSRLALRHVTAMEAENAALKADNARLREAQSRWRIERMEGRREALAILLRIDPETIDKCMGSHENGESGDYSTHWEEDKLRALLQCDKLESFADEVDGRYWTVSMRLQEAEEALAKANKWVLNHHDERVHADHACKECRPYSEILKEGFRCAYHAALAGKEGA